MAPAEGRWLPIFPLPAVLFPGGRLPLHIFEPRYRSMIARCEREGSPFAVLLVKDEALAQAGCEAWIEEIVERHDDGRVNLISRGGERLSLRELREHDDGYLEGRVEVLRDEQEEEDPDAASALLRVYSEFHRLIEEEEGAPEAEQLSPLNHPAPGYTFFLASNARLGPEERQGLLEMVSERRREEYLLRYLAQMLPVLRQTRETHRTVRGNGKLKPQK